MSVICDEAAFDLAHLDITDRSEHVVAVRASDAECRNIANILSEDKVVLIQGVSPRDADKWIFDIASTFNLASELEVQAGFAEIHGHRQRVGKYFMSVNDRSEYSFIPPHSEGTSAMNMQLASFYCFENSTDGGETVLWGVNAEDDVWSGMKELRYKIKTARGDLSKTELAMLKMMCEVELPRDLINDEDEILSLKDTPVKDVFRYAVLAPAKKSYSKILGADRFVCWDTIASVDWDIAKDFAMSLQRAGLFKVPQDDTEWSDMDSSRHRKVWSSGIRLRSLFSRVMVRKLRQGELVVMNNMTWAHSACGWTPGTGVRKLAAAFA